jgi:CRISPR/Cas system-associated endonuclease Cas3-HD
MKKKQVLEVEIPDWVPLESWNGYIEMRKAQKKPPTNYAVTLLLKKLNSYRQSGYELTAVLEQSIINNWIDVYPAKDQSRNMQGTGYQSSIDKHREIADALTGRNNENRPSLRDVN